MLPELNDSGASATFATTFWTVILQAARPDSPAGQAAFARLYSEYRRPLYLFVRRRGLSHHDAEDIIQSFFVRLLEKEALGKLRREGGRFRSFLLGAMSNYLANQWDHNNALKRGGAHKHLSLEAMQEEAKDEDLQLPDGESRESLFDKEWVATLLGAVQQRLRREMTGREGLFDVLKVYLQGDRFETGYAEVARAQGMTEGAVKVTIHRLRHRYGMLLREEIGRTVSCAEEVDEELRYLIEVVGSSA
jgi:RNA polymerase sigma-70 factor (ECF subfamily)